MENKLSPKEYWDGVLNGVSLPRINSPRVYNYHVTMHFVEEALIRCQGKTFLEIGCGSSGWLPYFARKYKFMISGLDYSEVGCHIAEENLKMLSIPYDEIICRDIFEWSSDKKYDIIFSYGVIEHFDRPEDVLKICFDHLNKKGIIITLVPNNGGMIGILSRHFVPKIFKMHKIISRDTLRTIHEKIGFHNVKTDYAGTFSLGVIPWSKSNSWLFRETTWRRKLSLKFIWLADLILSFFFHTFKIELPSLSFSPYVISIMEKSN